MLSSRGNLSLRERTQNADQLDAGRKLRENLDGKNSTWNILAEQFVKGMYGLR